MVPPSLKKKWPADFEVFRERCLPPKLAASFTCGEAERAVEFLKLLDDPESRRKSMIFVTHGAMSRGLRDPWVMLAVIAQAIKGTWHVAERRRTLSRFLGELLRMPWVEREGEDIWVNLLRAHPQRWREILERRDVLQYRPDPKIEFDDPVPMAVADVLGDLDTRAVRESLEAIPQRRSKHYKEKLRAARRALWREVRTVWKDCLTKLELRLPLLVLDEAHHLKNSKTRLASLFHADDAKADAEEISRGPLAGVFERMLFLTATPFQLGHDELCSVLARFDGAAWSSSRAPRSDRAGYQKAMGELRAALDAAQEAAVALDAIWGRLTPDDLTLDDLTLDDPTLDRGAMNDVESWWRTVGQQGASSSERVERVLKQYAGTRERMREAETRLRPWVIRHLKPRSLPRPHEERPRRRRMPGAFVEPAEGIERGISVEGRSLLPFLLAARATALTPQSRPVFAEGLASSFEAFLHTRRLRAARSLAQDAEHSTDTDDDPESGAGANGGTRLGADALWYLDRLSEFVPAGDASASMAHPKIARTVEQVSELWRAGEKVLVFCHYVATGRTLRNRISEAIDAEIVRLGAAKLGVPEAAVHEELERIGKRFFDTDSPIRRAIETETNQVLEGFDVLHEVREELIKVVRRFFRTPSFLVRFFPLEERSYTEESMRRSFDSADASGMTFRGLIRDFFHFLADRCGGDARGRYIDELDKVQTGTYRGGDTRQSYEEDELQGANPERLVPNVRLVNGGTKSETRQRLMLTFNTPFYPEVLVASSVMAEGVDLHLNCRHVIHHDLCWNPSTLEQRTGRVDRIGGKVERCGHPIHVYLPFIEATQDEKMYRVVMDRERWFNVVMGESYKVDVRSTEKLAERVPLPESVARELAFRLEVDAGEDDI